MNETITLYRNISNISDLHPVHLKKIYICPSVQPQHQKKKVESFLLKFKTL